MSLIKSKKERMAIKETGYRLAHVFEEIVFEEIIGKTTKQVDAIVHMLLKKYDLESCVLGYHGFPGYSCISLNDVVVHGVPSNMSVIQENDLVKIDICARYKHYCADMARPYFSKHNSNQVVHRLVQCGKDALQQGFACIKDNIHIGTMANAIQTVIESAGFSVVTSFTGHGIGKAMHEEPAIPNWGAVGEGQRLYEGMVIAVEPMLCEYGEELEVSTLDKWSAYTKDGGLACHIEDTIIVDKNGATIATRV